MSEQWRQEIIREKLAAMEIATVGMRANRTSGKLLGALVAYTILLAVPLIWARSSANIFIGGRAAYDVISRVDFALPGVETIADYPRYREIDLQQWLAAVLEPLTRLSICAENCDADRIMTTVQPLEISQESARHLAVYRAAASPAEIRDHLITPLTSGLTRWLYHRGVIAQSQYLDLHDRHLVEIEITDAHGTQSRIAGLDHESSPLATDQIRPVLQRIINDTLVDFTPGFRVAISDLLRQTLATSPTLLVVAIPQNDGLHNRIERGQILALRGQKISKADFASITAERRQWQRLQNPLIEVRENAALIIILFMLVFIYTHLFMQRVVTHRKNKLLGAGFLILLITVFACVCIRYGVALNAVPVAVIAGMVALTCGANVGMLSTVFFCLLLMIIGSRQFGALMTFIAGGCFFALYAPDERFRMGLAKTALFSVLAGVIAGFTYSVAINAPDTLILPRRFSDLLDAGFVASRVIWDVVSWILALLILLCTLSYTRYLFGVTSNITLQDYQEHPLLERLLANAPGTYYHSSVVSAIAAAGARALGVNETLCRIGCMYHDIGKLMKPQYFSENEERLSRHDVLSPYMSNVIIINHIKDGVEIARQFRLPPEIIDIIKQHHGTTRTEFFFRRAQEEAKREAEQLSPGAVPPAPLDASPFQYPGPRPQTIESAVIMLADSIEAASRSLNTPTPERLRNLIDKISYGKMTSGQFSECGVTFADLQRVKEAIIRLMTSMFHSRVSYDNVKRQR